MFDTGIDATTALLILLGVCAVCLVILLLLGRKFKKSRAPVEIPEFYPIEHEVDEEDLLPIEEEYEVVPHFDVRDDYEARLTRIRSERGVFDAHRNAWE